MSDQLATVYTDAVHFNLKQYATWPIGALLRLGDYGTLEGSQFKRIGNIADKPFSIECKEDKSRAPLFFDFRSAEVDETNTKAGASANVGSVPASINAKATLKFEKSNSVYFRSIRLVYSRIDNFAQISKDIMRKFESGSWNGNYVFISELFTSKGTTVIISNSNNAVIDVEAGAKGVEQIDLADANASLSVTHARNVGLKVIANQVENQKYDELVPLFTLAGVRPRFRWLPFLGGRTVRTMMASKEDPDFSPTVGALPGHVVANYKPEISNELAKDAGKEVDDVFQIEQIP